MKGQMVVLKAIQGGQESDEELENRDFEAMTSHRMDHLLSVPKISRSAYTFIHSDLVTYIPR